MITAHEAQQLQQQLSNARTILIVLGQDPSYDAVASASSLYLTLNQFGKEVTIASSADMRVEFSHIVGVDAIKKEIGNRDLVVSFDYQEGSVEKVSYNISDDSQKFNLIIAPKKGNKPIDPANLTYSYAGAEADLVFLFDTSSYEELGSIYEEEPELFTKAFTVSVNKYAVQPYAKMMLDTAGQSSLAEGIAELLRAFGMEPKDDVATNLLSSIEKETNNFQSPEVSASTFELIAHLLRNNGRRNTHEFAGKQMSTQETASFAKVLKARPTIQVPRQVLPQQGAMAQAPQQGQAAPQQGQAAPQQGQAAPQQAPQVFQPQQQVPQVLQPHQQQVQAEQQIHQIQRSIQEQAQQLNPSQVASQPGQQQNPPKEWLQPKIFTGTSKV